ncbi:MAG: hypothetical protein PHN69_04480 [Candidatus Pacebacteria bacterium]|nr:hypothetical protein [Fermentimonas sp.]MDD4804410.1 hypothetical protein [Candidatus Paceibacterota bacterium]
MILDVEVKKEFINILDKSQAFQICASAAKPMDCRKTQSELVGMYRYLNQGHVAEFKIRCDRLNQLLDQKIEALDPSVKSDYEQFFRFLQEGSNVAEKIIELSEDIAHLLEHTHEIDQRLEDRSFVLLQPQTSEKPKVESKRNTKGTTSTKGRKSNRRAHRPNGKTANVWEYVNKNIPAKMEVTGRQVAEAMGLGENEIKATSDALRHLYTRKKLRRRLEANKYYYWKPS